MPFEDLTKDDALNALKPIDKEQQATLDFLDGDHWQQGRAWVGPPDADVINRVTILQQKIWPIFVSKNIIKEIVEAHRDAVIGQEPDWSGATREALPKGQEPGAQLQALIDKATSLLTEWWDAKHIQGALQDATTNLLATGRGELRLVVPPGYIAEDGTPLPGNLNEWMGRIFLEAPDIDNVGFIEDENTRQQAAVFAIDKDGEKRVEVCFVDANSKTIIRKWIGEQEQTEGSVDINGNLLIFEMQRETLVTEQIRQNQALFNTTLTMRTRNVGVGGFPERNFMNAQPPWHFERDPEDPGKQIKVYDDFKTGPGVTNFVAGNEIEDENGNIKDITTATVSYRDPIKVDTFEATEKAAYQNILEEARQLHRLIARDATASGESRVQARADFVTSLRDTKTQVDAAGRWILETALALAAALSNSKDNFKSIRFRFESQIDTGPLSADERRIILEETQGDKPLRSVKSAIKLLGTDDPQAMIDEILSERELFAAKTPQQGTPQQTGMPVESVTPSQQPTTDVVQ